MILGTNGQGKKIFGQTLTANPVLPLPYTIGCDENDLAILYTDHPFNWGINFALYRLGDPRVMGDVYWFRNSYTQLKALRHENNTLACLIENIQQEQERHNRDINKFSQEIVAVWECLVAAKVRSWIAPLLAQLAVEGVIPDFIYPQRSPDDVQQVNSQSLRSLFNPEGQKMHPNTPHHPLSPRP